MTTARPTAAEAGELVHALVDRVARDAGARVLAIKGPAVAKQGLRAPRVSADIDVLVHPDDLDRLVDAMVAVGWHHAVVSSAPRVLRSHSVNLLNDHWPVGIDVHHFFPGFLAPERQVFDALWSRRSTIHFAGVAVTVCDPVGQAAVVGLHLLRDDPEGRGSRVADLVQRARDQLSEAQVRDLAALARETDAAPLRPILTGLGIHDSPSGTDHPEQLRAWEDRAYFVPGMAWGKQLGSNPWWRWPQLVWRAVMLTEAEIVVHHGADQTRRGRAAARMRRLGKVPHLLPGILRGLLRRGSHGGSR